MWITKKEVRRVWKSKKRFATFPKGPAWFTGAVRIDPLNQTLAPAESAVFGDVQNRAPGRLAPPAGPELIVTAGCGWAQRWGGREKRYGRATWSGFPRARSTGTARRRRRP